MNMSYCRFHNTLIALRECESALADMSNPVEELSPEEFKEFVRLVKICRRISEDFSEVK